MPRIIRDNLELPNPDRDLLANQRRVLANFESLRATARGEPEAIPEEELAVLRESVTEAGIRVNVDPTMDPGTWRLETPDPNLGRRPLSPAYHVYTGLTEEAQQETFDNALRNALGLQEGYTHHFTPSVLDPRTTLNILGDIVEVAQDEAPARRRRRRRVARGDREREFRTPRSHRRCPSTSPRGWPHDVQCSRIRGHRGDHIARDYNGIQMPSAARWREADCDWHYARMCNEDEQWCRRHVPGINGWVCSREPGHSGPHVAHDPGLIGEPIVHAWVVDRSVEGWPPIILASNARHIPGSPWDDFGVTSSSSPPCSEVDAEMVQ